MSNLLFLMAGLILGLWGEKIAAEESLENPVPKGKGWWLLALVGTAIAALVVAFHS